MGIDPLGRFLSDLGALYRTRRLYPGGNEQVQRAAQRTAEALARWGAPVRIAVLGDEVVVEDRAEAIAGHPLAGLLADLRASGCESVAIRPETTAEALARWLEAAARGGALEGPPGIEAGGLSFRGPSASPDEGPKGAPDQGALLPAVEEALADLASERKEGLQRAREIVSALAGHLAAETDLIQPIRDLKDHDDYTFTHALNVCALSGVLARALGARAELVDSIALGALCHDVGKYDVPREVLNFEGPLSPDDRQVMNGHPAHGARRLVDMGKEVHPLLPVIAYQHHMAADGSGYPRIPLPGGPHPASLIVAVADVFDALRTVRPYRGARTVAQACTVLLGDTAAGRLHRRHVSAFLGVFRVLGPGRAVAMSDGRRAAVLREGRPDALEPLVEAEDGQVVDLSLSAAPGIVEVLEAPP
ncbi:MAG: HD domain-containing protein [Deltaproteobacteria bacterium]|nr:HD domain-containing protein [Deltaproteobacteria bacterium]